MALHETKKDVHFAIHIKTLRQQEGLWKAEELLIYFFSMPLVSRTYTVWDAAAACPSGCSDKSSEGCGDSLTGAVLASGFTGTKP